MTETEVLEQVTIFNHFASQKPWLDVDIAEFSPHAAVLHCGIDLSVEIDIEIRFDMVFFVSLLMTWKTDTTSSVLQLMTGEEAKQLNMKYRIEQGCHLFAFSPEDLAADTRCLIAAKSFSWRQISRT